MQDLFVTQRRIISLVVCRLNVYTVQTTLGGWQKHARCLSARSDNINVATRLGILPSRYSFYHTCSRRVRQRDIADRVSNHGKTVRGIKSRKSIGTTRAKRRETVLQMCNVVSAKYSASPRYREPLHAAVKRVKSVLLIRVRCTRVTVNAVWWQRRNANEATRIIFQNKH